MNSEPTTFGRHPGSFQVKPVRLAMQTAIGFVVFFGLTLFLPAGDPSWPKGWAFVLVFISTTTLGAIYLWFANPEIYFARSRIHDGTKQWDRYLVALLLSIVTMIFPVAALDDGRFHWSAVSPWVVAVGYALVLFGVAATVWAEAVNRFFEPTVRIQTDRGHEVIDTGPYALVRHPGYVAAVSLFAGTALALGSWWALIPAGLASLVLVVRTRWEDQTLRSELPGYEEYARRVRYRLLPGVW